MSKVERVITVPCACLPDQSIGGGTATTEFYPGKGKAVAAVIEHVINHDPHWCVHWKGRHIVSVIAAGQQFGGSKPG